jgi:hypothetical protein
MQIAALVRCELQQQHLAMGTVRDVPDMARQKVTIGARHRVVLARAFQGQKRASKPPNTPCLREFHH